MEKMKINVTRLRKSLLLICFLLSVQSSFQAVRFRPSPCPGTFDYEQANDDYDRWYGKITLKINQTVESAIFRITLDKPSQLLVLQSWESPVSTTDNRIYNTVPDSSDVTLTRGNTYVSGIMVKFDINEAVPMLESIHLNGVRICPLDPAVLSSVGNYVTSSTGRPTHTTAPRPDLVINSETTDVIRDMDRRPTESSFNSGRPSSSGSKHRPSQGSNINKETAGFSNSETWNQATSSRPEESNSNLAIGGFASHVENSGDGSETWNKPTSRPSSTTSQANYRPTGNSNTHTDHSVSGSTSWNKPNSRPSTTNNNKGGSNSNSWSPNPNSINSGSSHSNNAIPAGSTNTHENNENSFNGDHSSSSNEGGSVVPCGTVSIANPLITSGQKTHHGQWPWHVALYKTESINLSYLCGGSLISKNKVITAAHCLVTTPGNKIINFKSLIVYLGKHNLRQYTGETGVQTKEVSGLKINPTYNSSNFHGDIAILTLSSDVEYTNYVRPVCTWEATNDIDDIEGKEGVVAGWGLTEYDQTSEELKKATLPVVSTETCLRSHPKFYAEYLSEYAFCAGFRNGTSPCNGDSGGGLVFKRNNNTWYLRGVVSLSVAKEGLNFCDPNYYVIFTDTARYVDFIKKNSSRL